MWLILIKTLSLSTGVLQTNQSYGKYADGYFEVKVKASNSPDPTKADFTYIKIFVLQDTDLMKFVFDKNPVQVHTSSEAQCAQCDQLAFFRSPKR